MRLIKYIAVLILIITIGCSEDTVSYTGIGKITGRVVEDSNFTPIENAKIELTPSNNTVFTDVDGYFVFEEVEEGEYSVSAIKEGFLTGFEPATVTQNLEVNVVFELQVETANNRPPSTPELISPEDNSTDRDLSVELKWSSIDPDGDEITYKLKIKNGNNNEEQLIESLKDSTYVLSDLLSGTKYFWQISATDSINSEVWSSVSSFETKKNTKSRYLYVKKLNDNNVIYAADGSGFEIALTPSSLNSWRPRKNLTTNLIAFLRTDENFETQIYTMNPDGSDVFKVTTIPVKGFKQSELDFSWSANGSKLIYPQFDKLYEIQKDGSGLRLIYQTPDGSFISECDWSNDGNVIALKTNNSNGYNISIYTIDINGNKITDVLSGVNGAAGGINLSVDGKKLLYTYDISGFESSNYRQLDSRLFVYNLESNSKEDISIEKTEGTIDIDPRFSPDEAKVIFVNTSNDGISAKNIFTQYVNKDNNNDDTNFGREEVFPDAIMPDWE